MIETEVKSKHETLPVVEIFQGKERAQTPTMLLLNTRVWLNKLSEQYKRPITIGTVPDEVWGEAREKFDAIWFMGIYQESEEGRKSAKNYTYEYRPTLPDLDEERDVVSSPFAIPAYVPNPRIATDWEEWDRGVASFRQSGGKVFTDFVPNHVALDHPWAREHPEYFIRGQEWQVAQNQGSYYPVVDIHGQKQWIAHGKDPNFPSWIDTLQLNYANPDLQQVMEQQVLTLGDHVDGVRCDMAMLLNPNTFMRTWGDHLSDREKEFLWTNEFWPNTVGKAKEKARKQGKTFEFIAEAYWDKNELGEHFDQIYEKEFYDHLRDTVHGVANPEGLRQHLAFLTAQVTPYNHTVFTENHDEKRAIETFGYNGSMAAAVITSCIPGGYWLVHDGQQEGRIRKLPMQVNRLPRDEQPIPGMPEFYNRLLKMRNSSLFRQGEWSVPYVDPSFPTNRTHENIIAQHVTRQDQGAIICTNTSQDTADGHIPIFDKNVRIEVLDINTGEFLDRDEIGIPSEYGLYVRLDPLRSQAVFYSPDL